MNDHSHVSNRRAAPLRRLRRLVAGGTCLLLLGFVVLGGCAKYNTYYNAKKNYDEAEHVREERLKVGEDVSRATPAQKQNYDLAIKKAQKILDDFPGHGLTDDALFLQGKSYQRIASYRMSIRKLDLLFTNFPQTPYLEESLYLQAVNYLLLGDAGHSQDLLDRLDAQYPDSRFQSQALRASGDNAFALERWEDAVSAYTRFLERFPDAENWDDSSMRLATALFELDRFSEAVDVLQRVVDESLMSDRVFRARLLQARCLIRMRDHERAEAIIGDLKGEAMIESKQGDVALVEAENLLAQGDRGAAIALLEGLTQEELTREVKPVRADLLGEAAMSVAELEDEDLEQARDQFQEALTGSQYLDDADATRTLLASIKDYLGAQGQIADAEPTRAAELRLRQANAMLFGFDRSRRALDLYATVAADTAADSLVAARGIYGAMIVYDAYLDVPDSAALYRDDLQARYPDSPQAYQARGGADTDLLAYLLAQEEAALAAARPDTLIGLEDLTGITPTLDELETGLALRRRQVYLQRRELLVYPPSALAVRMRDRRLAAEELALDARDSTEVFRAADLETVSFDAAAAETLGTSPFVSTAPDTAMVPVPAPADTVARPPEEEPEAEPEKEKKKSWDF